MKSVLRYFKLEVQCESFSNGSVSYMKCYQVRPVRKVENKKKIYFFWWLYGRRYIYVCEKKTA